VLLKLLLVPLNRVFVGQGTASGSGSSSGKKKKDGGAAGKDALAASGGGGGGMKQAEQEAALVDFRAGVINVLLATSIGEEGLDIPEVRPAVCSLWLTLLARCQSVLKPA